MKRTTLGGLVAAIVLNLFVLFPPVVLACANDNGVISNTASFNPNHIPTFIYDTGWRADTIGEIAYLVASPLRDWAKLERTLADADQRIAVGPSLDNARAVVLMRLSRPDEAVNLLLVSEHTYPGRYDTAANLGTSYELSGNLEKAKEWIKEGIARNPESHDGTEWLHVRILEARLALAEDPNWLKEHSVTGLRFGSEAQPDFSRIEEEEDTIRALQYQLRERISFVSPPDPVVGDMLYDLACLLYRKETPEHALAHFRLAEVYAPEMERPLQARIEMLEHRLEEIETLATKREAESAAQRRLQATEITEQRYSIEYAEMKLLMEDLERLVPGVSYRMSLKRRTITAKGTGEEHRQVRRLLEILDQPGR